MYNRNFIRERWWTSKSKQVLSNSSLKRNFDFFREQERNRIKDCKRNRVLHRPVASKTYRLLVDALSTLSLCSPCLTGDVIWNTQQCFNIRLIWCTIRARTRRTQPPEPKQHATQETTLIKILAELPICFYVDSFSNKTWL